MSGRRRPRAGSAPRWTLVSVPWLIFACSGEGSSLGKGPELGPGGNTSGGSAGARSGGSGGLDFPEVPQMGGQGTGGWPVMMDPPEPPGTDVLTFVHGIVDATFIAVCFVTADGEALGEPAPADGLGFGESLVLEAIDGVDFAEDAAQPLVLAGDLALVEGQSCADALDTAREEQGSPLPVAEDGAGVDVAEQAMGAGGAAGSEGTGNGGAAGEPGSGGAAGGDALGGTPPVAGGAGDGGAGGEPAVPVEPPRLRIGELPLLPAGTISGGRSLLLVATGCLGGRSSGDEEEDQLACGEGYSLERPTLGAVLVRISRRTSLGKLGIQVVHASRGTGIIDVSSAPAPGVTDTLFTLASQLRYGVILPRSPRLDVSAAGIGASRIDWRLRAVSGGSELYTEPWRAIADRSGVLVEDGHTYALVLLGPWLGLGLEGFWNYPRAALYDTDPLPAEGVGAP